MAEKPDKPHIWLVRQPQGFIGYSQFDRDLIERYRIGAHVVCTIEQPRDPKTVKRIYGLIGLVANGMGEDRETMKVRLMTRCGSIRAVDHIEGLGTTIAPQRIRDMEEPDLLDLWDRMVAVVITDFLPFMPRQDLIDQVNQYIGVRS